MNEWRKVFQHFKDYHGWNNNQLCAKLGIFPSNIATYINGSTDPSWTMIQKWARRLGIDLLEFVAIYQMAKEGRLDGTSIQLPDNRDEEIRQLSLTYGEQQGASGEYISGEGKEGVFQDKGNGSLSIEGTESTGSSDTVNN